MGQYEDDGSNSPKISVYTPTWRAWTKPGFGFAFVQFASSDVTVINADPDIYVLPDGAMDMSVGSIPAATRNTIKTRLEAAGFTFADVKTSWTVRQLLNYIARQVQTGIDVEVGDIPDSV